MHSIHYRIIFVTVICILVILFLQLYNLIEYEKNSALKKRSAFKFYPVDRTKVLQIQTNMRTGSNMIMEKCDITKPLCSYDPMASCIYMEHPFKFVSLNSFDEKKSDAHIYSPNKHKNEGYCLNILNSNHNAKRAITENRKNLHSCNPNTGERIVVKTSIHSNAYKIGCLCKHPDVITQTVPLYSDCDKPVACRDGQLNGPSWWNSKIKVDIIKDLSCVNCPNDTISDRDSLTDRPICRERTFAEKNIDDSQYVYPKNFPLIPLNHQAIEPDFVNKFSHPQTRYLPNPCGFDIFTMQPFHKNECSLASTSDGTIAFCKSNDINVVTVQLDDDYLRGNAGKWANGCFKFTENNTNINYAIAEFYNVIPTTKGNIPHPIVGYAVNSSKLSSEAFHILDLKNIK